MDNMTDEKKNLILFYHKNHSDPYNGTSVYINFLIQRLSDRYHIIVIEPENKVTDITLLNGFTAHYFFSLLKNVYLRQFKWVLDILRGRHLTPPYNTILMVEDIYSAPIPLIVSKIKGYNFVYRVADFGKSYSRELFRKHKIDAFIYGILRNLLERALVKNSALIICPSENLKNLVVVTCPYAINKVIEVPYSNKEHFKPQNIPLGESSKGFNGQQINLLFLGDCRYPPNFEAANFILEHVVPALEDLSDYYTLYIAGPNSEKLLYSNSPNVRILGKVPDKELLLNSAHIGLAPLQTSGGLSMKVVDYLTHGLHVVATPEAAFGIVPNEQLRIADYSNFSDILHNQIKKEMNNDHKYHFISKEVMEVYMTDKWTQKLLEKMNNIAEHRND
jgi:hypothetical protein